MVELNWIVYAATSAVMMGLMFVASKVGSVHTDTLVATSVVAVSMTGILLLACAVQGKFALDSYVNSQWFYLVVAGLCSGLSWLTYFAATKIAPLYKLGSFYLLCFVVAMIGFAYLVNGVSAKLIAGSLLLLAGSVCFIV